MGKGKRAHDSLLIANSTALAAFKSTAGGQGPRVSDLVPLHTA
jgi:hypothetical protein